MRVILKDKAKFYAQPDTENPGSWTFQVDGASYYRYSVNSFEYNSKIVEYLRISESARMYKASGYRVLDVDVSVSMHKDNEDEGDHLHDKYVGADKEVWIFVDAIDSADPVEVEEGDYIEVDIDGFDEAVSAILANMSFNPSPEPTPTEITYQIVSTGDSTSIFSTRPTPGEDYDESKDLFSVGIATKDDEEDLYVMIEEEGSWFADTTLRSEHPGNQAWFDVVDAIWEEMANDEATYAWVAIDPVE